LRCCETEHCFAIIVFSHPFSNSEGYYLESTWWRFAIMTGLWKKEDVFVFVELTYLISSCERTKRVKKIVNLLKSNSTEILIYHFRFVIKFFSIASLWEYGEDKLIIWWEGQRSPSHKIVHFHPIVLKF